MLNHKCNGHGAATHYAWNFHNWDRLIINNCNFLFNRADQNLVYIKGPQGKHLCHVYVQHSIFVANKEVHSRFALLYFTSTSCVA